MRIEKDEHRDIVTPIDSTDSIQDSNGKHRNNQEFKKEQSPFQVLLDEEIARLDRNARLK